MTERRRFLAKAGRAMAAVAAATLVDAPNVIAQPKVQWRMSTTWVPALDQLNGAARRLATIVEGMSGGRFRIEVLPGGQIHAAAAVQAYGLSDYHTKNALALERLRTEFKGEVEVLQLPVPVLRDLKKVASEVVKEESEKTPMARKVHASFAKFQALLGPWDHVAEGAYHQLVAPEVTR